MNAIFKKVNIGFILILSMVMIAACSTGGESTGSASEQAGSNDTNNNRENKDTPDSNLSTQEIDIPKSSLSISKMAIGSFTRINSMDIDSSIDKEVMDTLNEFNAVNTDDGAKLTLPEDILFDFDSDELRSEADKVIDQLFQAIETTDDKVTIVGHTDNKGGDDYNQTLSENRAEAVKQALIDAGVEEDLLESKGAGASEPVAENTKSDGSDNPEGRQRNRRVEVTLHGFE